ncbi:hypothetical protein HDU86_008127 [Geranomyces michiganensis]|nr:hypothetical protein HDU86_008127 [Geranomyces michiganensis]
MNMLRPGIPGFLRNCEQGGGRPQSLLAAEKQMFSCVYPTDTLYGVETPPITLRKFSPDGMNFHAVRVYRYVGQPDRHSDSSTAFEDFFEVCFETVLTGGNELLSKDFLLFSRNGRHIIVASAVGSEQSEWPRSQPRSSMGIESLCDLDDITFWVLDVKTGQILYKQTYQNDFIYLNHNSGVHLFMDTFAITSVKYQCIYMLHVTDAGTFVHLRTLGRYTNDDDEIIISNYHSAEKWFRKRKRCEDDDEETGSQHRPRRLRRVLSRLDDSPPAQVVSLSPPTHRMFQALVPLNHRQYCCYETGNVVSDDGVIGETCKASPALTLQH